MFTRITNRQLAPPRPSPVTLLTVGCVLLLSGVATCYGYIATRQFVIRSARQNALLQVQQGVDEIDQWLAILKDRISTMGRTPMVKTMDWAILEPYLQRELGAQSNFFKLTAIDIQGYRIGNTSVGYRRTDLRDRVYYQQAKAGRTYTSDTMISRTTGYVQVIIATPVWSSEPPAWAAAEASPAGPKRPIGILSGSVNINRLVEIIDQLRYGADSYAFILNSQGQAMVHPDRSLMSTIEQPAPSLLDGPQHEMAHLVGRMIEGERGIELVPIESQPQYVAYLPLQEAHWYVGLVIPRKTIEQQLPYLNLIAFVVVTLMASMAWVLWQAWATERAQLQASMVHAKAVANAAAAANRAKGKFLSQVSHELRTPLNGIIGYAQILQSHGETRPSQIQGLTVIRRSGEHLLSLIEDILDIAKDEAYQLSLKPQPVHLPHLLAQVTAIVQPGIEDKPIELSWSADPQIQAWVSIDPQRLQQILLNLLGNAVKFTQEGAVRLRAICLGRQESQVTVRFEIQDTGIGIHRHHWETIFHAFERVDTAQSLKEGMGLGLAIAQQWVKKMGGALQVDSVPSSGSKFWFDLTLAISHQPVAAVPPVADAAPPAAAVPPPSSLPKEEYIILHELAQFGNMQKIRDYAEYLQQRYPTHGPFLQRLVAYAEQFEDEKIISLIEKYL